jgi:hypothetical protein
MDTIEPLSPSQALQCKTQPPIVIKAVNTLITQRFTSGSFTITQDELINEILSFAAAENLQVSRQQLFANGWLDIEHTYNRTGWRVTYNKPSIGDQYLAYFTFTPMEQANG